MKLNSVFAPALLALSLATPIVSYAHVLTQDERVSDLDQLVSIIKSGYGPLHYKKNVLGIDVDQLRNSYLEKVKAAKTNGDFYYLLLQFVAEFKDSHFGASIPTNKQAALPFSTDLVGGKVLIDTIDRSSISEKEFPFAKGDEILSLNEVPASKVLDELQTYLGSGYDQTARRRAAMVFSFRPGKQIPVPSGDAVLTIRRGTSNVIDTVTLKWKVTGEDLDENLGGETLAAKLKALKARSRDFAPITEHHRFDTLSIADYWQDLDRDFEKSFRCSGTTRVTIPKDATMIFDKPFVAYYHPTPKGNIGYLRIPEYMATNPDTGKSEFELRFKQYEYAISVLEKNTVGLIIDQDHNCGGSVSYLGKIVGLFMDKPYEPMQFQILANKEEYLSFKKEIDEEVAPNTLEYNDAMDVLNLLKKSWLAGDFMTPKTSLFDAKLLTPNPVHYTKPIVMLVDEMSGSGGDAFPALMQGYGRAKLLGTRTMGAGGHVIELPGLNYSQVALRMTKSLFFRPDGIAVENNGAAPDYAYTPTRDDFVYGYRDYQAFYINKLLDLITP